MWKEAKKKARLNTQTIQNGKRVGVKIQRASLKIYLIRNSNGKHPFMNGLETCMKNGLEKKNNERVEAKEDDSDLPF